MPVRSTVTLSGSDWIGVHMTDASVLKGITRVPLFTGFISLFGIAGLFGLLALLGLPFATWVRERARRPRPPDAERRALERGYFRLNCGRRGASDGAIASVLWRKLIRPFSRS